MANIDWRDVYIEERRRPGYVLEDGRSQVKRGKSKVRKPKATLPAMGKRKAA